MFVKERSFIDRGSTVAKSLRYPFSVIYCVGEWKLATPFCTGCNKEDYGLLMPVSGSHDCHVTG